MAGGRGTRFWPRSRKARSKQVLPVLGEASLLQQTYARHFLERHGRPGMRLSGGLLQWMAAYDWPGNVRELENCMQRMVALSSSQELDVEDLPTQLRNREAAGGEMMPRLVRPLAVVEGETIAEALRLAGGDRGRAARLLGIGRTTLYRKLKKEVARAAEPCNHGRSRMHTA